MKSRSALIASVLLATGASCFGGPLSAMPFSSAVKMEPGEIQTVQFRRGGGLGRGNVMGGGVAFRSAPGPRFNSGGANAFRGANTIRGYGTFRSAQGPNVNWQHNRWRGGRWAGPALGFGAGLALGSAFASPYYYNDYYGNGAYGYSDGGYYNNGYYDQDTVAYCQQRYRSYDPTSGTYLGYDGLRHPCP
jgi:hypothetical protein